MNRKQWLIAGIVIVIVLVTGVILLVNVLSKDKKETGQRVPASELSYCAGEQFRPCVVSFSMDANDNMLVNLLLPDRSFPDFYLKIILGETENTYQCQRIGETIDNAYCTGEKLPPGEMLHLALISIKGSVLLAEGNLSIIGLAYPTVGIALPTLEESPTLELSPTSTASPTDTPLSLFVLSTPTKTITPAYPNPSYPNPSYPNPSYPNPTASSTPDLFNTPDPNTSGPKP